MAEFARTATPLAPGEMALLFVDAYKRVHGALPDRNTAELYLALAFNENASGKAIYNHNWGNVIAVGNQDFVRPPWYDEARIAAVKDPALRARYQRLHDQMHAKPGTVPTKFAAYPSHAQGADRWVKVLASDRYTGTRKAARLGDAEQFAYFIWSEGYCPDDACQRLGPAYAKLREKIREQGWLAALPVASDTVVQETNGTWMLRPGYQYRITESSPVPIDQASLKRQLEDSGATDVTFASSARYEYSYTTPIMAVEFSHFAALVPGGRIERVVQIPDGDTRKIRRSNGGLVLAATLSILGAMLLSSRGSL